MRNFKRWSRFITEIIRRYNTTFITLQEFENDLTTIIKYPDSPLRAVKYQIKCNSPFEDFNIGKSLDDKSTMHTSHKADKNREISFLIEFWETDSNSQQVDVSTYFEELFRAFWKENLRVTPSGLVTIRQSQDALDCAERTLRNLEETDEDCSLLFCDLDNFKSVNDHPDLGYSEGNRVIEEFASILEKATENFAIPLNNGGDEFVILYPKSSCEDSILLAHKISELFQKHDFKTKDVSVGVSIGLVATEEFEKRLSIEDLLERAETALKQEVKQKTKGVARFVPCSENNVTELDKAALAKLSVCLTKTGTLQKNIYNNVWLNAISNIAHNHFIDSGVDGVQNVIDSFIDWSKIDICDSNIKTAFQRKKKVDLIPSVSSMDIGISIAHGALSASFEKNYSEIFSDSEGKDLILEFDKKTPYAALHFSDSDIFWSLGEKVNSISSLNIGKLWKSDKTNTISEKSLKKAILIKIGHKELSFPEILFSEVIVVDNRPTKGGGLPDFWEATIARLIASLHHNPNITMVFLVGEKEYGMRTIDKLNNISSWDEKIIHYKTSMPIDHINEAKKRLKNNIYILNKDSDILDHLTPILERFDEPYPLQQSSSIEQSNRFLKRHLTLEKMKMLDKTDGCRVGTIFESYPTVLEIMRNVDNKALIHDQAGQELQELVDFKVHLERPLIDKIPLFYKNEENSLKEYFKKCFLPKEKGIFGKPFVEHRQFDRVIDHIVYAINKCPEPFATRRGILVIPHQPGETREITPLGLVSIRIIPRMAENKITINYSFTWRTVEVLVGFPYSIYGSVCYGEFLTEHIRNKLPQDMRAHVEMGFVSYIAHSLHMFMDTYGQNIAKRIVDEASF